MSNDNPKKGKSTYTKKVEAYENSHANNERLATKKEAQRRRAIELQGYRPKPIPPTIQKLVNHAQKKAAKILGLNPSTLSKEVIQQKYKELALIHHPDKGGKKEDFIRIKQAYDDLITMNDIS